MTSFSINSLTTEDIPEQLVLHITFWIKSAMGCLNHLNTLQQTAGEINRCTLDPMQKRRDFHDFHLKL